MKPLFSLQSVSNTSISSVLFVNDSRLITQLSTPTNRPHDFSPHFPTERERKREKKCFSTYKTSLSTCRKVPTHLIDSAHTFERQ